jgi:hypothetical protein
VGRSSRTKNGILLEDANPASVLKFKLKDAGLAAVIPGTSGKSSYGVEKHKRRDVEKLNVYAESKGFQA